MKKMISKFADFLLSREDLKNVKGGYGTNYYFACNDNYESISYITVEAANRHCQSSIACTKCSMFST